MKNNIDNNFTIVVRFRGNAIGNPHFDFISKHDKIIGLCYDDFNNFCKDERDMLYVNGHYKYLYDLE